MTDDQEPGAIVETADRLAPSRVLRVLGAGAILGGILTFVSIIAPHADHTYDAHYIGLGVLVIVFGAALRVHARTREVSLTMVHAAIAAMSIFVLVLAWLGMRDLGGIQVILLVIVLGIAASVGPSRWAYVLAACQSTRYAIVLATSPSIEDLDKLSQWQVVTIALVVCTAFNDMLRRELQRTRSHDARRQAERERERELHAERLERLNEELRDASELKSSFVAMASHELRTPLTAIEGFATTLQDRWDELGDDDKRAFLAIIEGQSQRLARLVGDLLTISRIESGRLHAHPTRVALDAAIERALTTLGPIPDVQVSCGPDVLALVDADHLQQALVNYLANAATHGSRPITVEAHERDGDVVVSVCDNGPGVEPELADELFQRFTRGRDSETRETGGAGLGLSIVSGLVEANDGACWYEPNEPNGSCFYLRVPRATS